jgi:hypothetical protein
MKNEKAKNKAVEAIRTIVQAAKELAAAEEAYRKSKQKYKRSVK